MTPAELRALASASHLSLPLQALWADGQGDWSRAHDLCQEAESREGDWVHAYLHRKEGDLSNAGYWYARARRSPPAASVSLDKEWNDLVSALLASNRS